MFMGKNRDVVQIILIVLGGMFLPFFITLVLLFHVDVFSWSGWVQIITAFFYFLLIFGVELGSVILYFHITNHFAEKKLLRLKRK